MANTANVNAIEQVKAAMSCPAAHLRISAVELMVGRKRAWLYKSAAAGTFPKPAARGRWQARDVMAWLESGAART